MLQLDALAALQLAVFQQQLAPSEYVVPRRGDFVLGDHALDDAETLDVQRLQVAFDLGVAVFGNAGADGVGNAGAFIEICLFYHGKFILYSCCSCLRWQKYKPIQSVGIIGFWRQRTKRFRSKLGWQIPAGSARRFAVFPDRSGPSPLTAVGCSWLDR